ncbi:MAG TPA: HEAT repeat domain-containing protein [Pyrinomonadaceae bacterium]|nr:HEAT repeat domain-containing protein [Pyrinomonadaceae bacterium]
MPPTDTITDDATRTPEPGAGREVRALTSLLGHDDWQTRRAAASAIAASISAGEVSGIEFETLLEELFAALGDNSGAGRRAAAIAALEGVVALAETRSLALGRIESALVRAGSTVRIGLAGVVGAAGGAEAVRLLAPLAEDEETNVAAAAVAALGRTRSPEATPLLVRHLDAANDWLRFAVVGALGELGDARAVAPLELLLEDQLLQEAAASALCEIATVDAACALARHLRSPCDGALRPSVLKSLVSIATDERALPRAVAEEIYRQSRALFRVLAEDEATLSELLHQTYTLDPARAAARITALGWSGDARAVPRIAQALSEPATSAAAHAALAALIDSPRDARTLPALLAQPSELLPHCALAAALAQAETPAALEAAARLGAATDEAETRQTCASALAHARERMLRGASPLSADERLRLLDALLQSLPTAQGELLVELSETLGMLLADAAPQQRAEAVAALPADEGETQALARLAFFERAGAATDDEALCELVRAAERHTSARVRVRAIEFAERRGAFLEEASFVSHLTDEATGVRRAAARALRRQPTRDVRRELLAALADEDIWVTAESIVTLGARYGDDPEVRARLLEQLAAAHPLCRVAAAEALSKLARDAEEWRALAQLARRDPFPEVRHAAMCALARCGEARTVLSAARAALKDAEWPVRRAAVEVLSASTERPASRLLSEAAVNEEPAVRGAALRALAERGAAEAVTFACRAVGETDSALIEDAYAALRLCKRTCPEALDAARHTCAPRAAAIIAFIVDNSDK